MSIREYIKKRNFSQTPEPGVQKHLTVNKKRLIFVVQKHAASHLHYDFRLEMNGTLKSWAVPKGPSLDPSVKRLSVHVEDHPLDYANFSGIIPKGQYGAGTVEIWDKGIWEPENDMISGYKKGVLEFILHGKKLHGHWKLFRIKTQDSKKNNWLLVKSKDSESKSAKKLDVLDENLQNNLIQKLTDNSKASPIKSLRKITPQLATLVNTPPVEENWIYEIKYDGYRFLTYIGKTKIEIITRNKKDWTKNFSNIKSEIDKLGLHQTVLDDEIVAVDKNHHFNFQLLQNSIHLGKEKDIHYYVFDMPFCCGFDIRNLPLIERKKILKKIFQSHKDMTQVHYSDYIEGSGNQVWKKSCELGLEGIIAKEEQSTYESKRTKTWLKIKCMHRQEFLIVGFTKSSVTNLAFGALLLGYYDKNELIYCGHVGTGFSLETRNMLKELLFPLIIQTSPFKEKPDGVEVKKTFWVKIKLIAEVQFTEWSESRILRHPSFLGLRGDKKLKDITREKIMIINEENKIISHQYIKKSINNTKLTHPDKILFSNGKITKEDLAKYYLSVSDWILPFITNRPLMLLRCPEGSDGDCFFQKHASASLSKDIYRIEIQEKKDKDQYLYIKDEAGLLAVVQLGSIELHPWASKTKSVETPDYITFDLDPGPGVEWKQMIQAAYRLHDFLEKNQLQTFVKTSGKKGLHVVVPLNTNATWDEIKKFAQYVAIEMDKAFPNEYVTTITKNKRINKILIDYFRNNRGSTTVAAYSCRVSANASVSLPISWTELSSVPSGDYYDIHKTLNRLKKLANDPWENFFSVKQKIKLEGSSL